MDEERNAHLTQAWALSYLDPSASMTLARAIADDAAQPPVLRGEAALLVALAEVRAGDAATADEALAQARACLPRAEQPRLAMLCDEVEAIALRRAGRYAESQALQAAIDARGDPGRTALDRFIAHNSRAITDKLLGQIDSTLRHFYAAADAAEATGLPGPYITALANLGGQHQVLHNLDDARQHSEQALAEAQKAHALPAMVAAAVNLVVLYHSSGEAHRARAMVGFITHTGNPWVDAVLPRYALALAVGHLAVGEYDAAERYLEQGAVRALGDGDGNNQWAWLRARCLMHRGQIDEARRLCDETLAESRQAQLSEQPNDLLELLRTAADAHEAAGDAVSALGLVRRAQTIYEQLVGRSARARYIALQVRHQLAHTERERDGALELNQALQARIAETEMLHARLREQALRDPLTGLHNRRYLFEMAPVLLELSRRQGTPLCVVLIDLDHFKLLNDTYGHQAGDQVLQRFATLMGSTLRRSDVVCRHGGEEFVALMPDIDLSGAQVVLERLLAEYQVLDVQIGRRRLPHCSFSAGVALFPAHGHTLEQLLTRADRTLYLAKSHGRARIETALITDFSTLS